MDYNVAIFFSACLAIFGIFGLVFEKMSQDDHDRGCMATSGESRKRDQHSTKGLRYFLMSGGLTFLPSLSVLLYATATASDHVRLSVANTSFAGLCAATAVGVGIGLKKAGWLFALRISLFAASMPAGLLIWSKGCSIYLAAGVTIVLVALAMVGKRYKPLI